MVPTDADLASLVNDEAAEAPPGPMSLQQVRVMYAHETPVALRSQSQTPLQPQSQPPSQPIQSDEYTVVSENLTEQKDLDDPDGKDATGDARDAQNTDDYDHTDGTGFGVTSEAATSVMLGALLSAGEARARSSTRSVRLTDEELSAADWINEQILRATDLPDREIYELDVPVDVPFTDTMRTVFRSKGYTVLMDPQGRRRRVSWRAASMCDPVPPEISRRPNQEGVTSWPSSSEPS